MYKYVFIHELWDYKWQVSMLINYRGMDFKLIRTKKGEQNNHADI